MERTISPIKLNPYDRDDLSHSFLRSIRDFYSDPANLAKFEEWKKKKKGEKHER